jgi:hypothetical protein
VTYSRDNNHTIGLYFDGALLSTASSPPEFDADVISWETAESIYINRFYVNGPSDDTHYHRLAIFNRRLTESEVLTLYNEKGTFTPLATPPDPNLLLDIIFDVFFSFRYWR